MEQKKTSAFYKFLKWIVRHVYPEIRVCGAENLPEEPALLIGNHSQLHGPIASELYIPGDHYTWCIGQMMHRKEVAAYAYQDFWSGKPKCTRWFFKLVSHLIAPLSACVFTNANTIGVYHDARLVYTFKETVSKLQEGASVVIFPEHYAPYSNVVNDFQDKFVDVARIYYKKTGQTLCFVPMYLAPALKTLVFGKPIRFSPDIPMDLQRRQICDYLMDEITALACALPAHQVVPYPNIPKKQYPNSLPRIDYKEVSDEKTSG